GRFLHRRRRRLKQRSPYTVDLEEVLARVAELSREELRIVRKRAEEKTAARDHGQDYHEMEQAADRLATTRTSCDACTTTSSVTDGGTRAGRTPAADTWLRVLLG